MTIVYNLSIISLTYHVKRNFRTRIGRIFR
nr:MAG TPA: hypothetical protein [Caudoviricetes sp.]